MNETSATSASGDSLLPTTTDVFTTAHLAIIAIFAVLVILGILYGARLKAKRKAGEREIEERHSDVDADATGSTAPSAYAAPEPEAAPTPTPAPKQVAPTPPVVPPAHAPVLAEPIASTTPASPAPASAAPPSTTAAGPGADGSVTLLKGLGPKVATRLADLGVTTVGQIAALDADAADRLDAQLGNFAGRMQRDRWIEQARFLAAGDKAGFEKVFGKL